MTNGHLATARPPETSDSSADGDVIRRSCYEPELFAEVFRRHAAAIARYAARRLGPGPAEDIVAETFLAAFRQRDRYDAGRPDARPWLFGIAGNLIRRHCRDEARLLLALERTGVDPVAESFTERAEARLAAGAAGRAAAAALASLDPDQRDVVLLITWAGRRGGGGGCRRHRLPYGDDVGQRPLPPPAPGGPPRPAATAVELVADATRAAQAAPDAAPNPHAWVYAKSEVATSAAQAQDGTLLGPVDGTVVSQQWSRVDGREVAFLQDGKLMVAPGGGTPGSWQSTSYSYFESLPTDPARLAALIEANNKTDNYVVGGGAIGVFNAVEALLQAPVVLPPKLLAALYAVLATEPGVSFEPHVTDIAGRADAAFFIDQEGYDRSEILVNPTTYGYMGSLDVAYAAHVFPAQVSNGVATGPYTHVSAGQILGEDALLESGLVEQPGQVLP
jgi:RNA polymerase sigma factor (sigma-70 family)